MEKTSTVCVTGGSGYIGSWLVKKLLRRRYHVHATVRNSGISTAVYTLASSPQTSSEHVYPRQGMSPRLGISGASPEPMQGFLFSNPISKLQTRSSLRSEGASTCSWSLPPCITAPTPRDTVQRHQRSGGVSGPHHLAVV
ncbi:hypothetical protein MUK42_11373 [Musa troglodytarum]|uniref:NAD(P)-binding domain-containing protein n=1 Tax=Musa troglodytarum TaxID=320322 RepID=A0A9E7GT76_9LILI|nr:hypothetical protein MUK42_11373 [Musa troglodytarum]